jgi:hypothetical protein
LDDEVAGVRSPGDGFDPTAGSSGVLSYGLLEVHLRACREITNDESEEAAFWTRVTVDAGVSEVTPVPAEYGIPAVAEQFARAGSGIQSRYGNESGLIGRTCLRFAHFGEILGAET